MRHLLLLIFILLGDGVLSSQQPGASKSFKLAEIEDFVSDPQAVRDEKVKFHKAIDPNAHYPLSKHQSLWDENVELRLSYRPITPQQKADSDEGKFTIDAFGLSVTGLMHDKYPELANDAMKRVRGEVIGKRLSYDDLYDLTLALDKELKTVWGKSGAREDSLILRAALANHFSALSKKNECWFLIEVFHANSLSHDLFIRDVIDRAVRAELKGAERYKTDRLDGQFYTSSHPMVQESRFLRKNRELARDRNEVRVPVHDDRLTIAEREKKFGFKVIDEGRRRKKFYQIEDYSLPSVDDDRVLRVLSEANDLFFERGPCGSYLSFEELHLRAGSVADVLSRKFPAYKLVVTIQESKVHGSDYSNLCLEVVSGN